MHAASAYPEPGSNSPKMHSLAAATSSEGLTARTSFVTDFPVTLQLLRCSVRGTTARGADPQSWGLCNGVSNLTTMAEPLWRPIRPDLLGGGTAANTR